MNLVILGLLFVNVIRYAHLMYIYKNMMWIYMFILTVMFIPFPSFLDGITFVNIIYLLIVNNTPLSYKDMFKVETNFIISFLIYNIHHSYILYTQSEDLNNQIKNIILICFIMGLHIIWRYRVSLGPVTHVILNPERLFYGLLSTMYLLSLRTFLGDKEYNLMLALCIIITYLSGLETIHFNQISSAHNRVSPLLIICQFIVCMNPQIGFTLMIIITLYGVILITRISNPTSSCEELV